MKIKKIAVAAIGTLMLGATLTGATATVDLNNYPTMFLDGTVFDGEIGVGDHASTQDVVGAIDVVRALSIVTIKEPVEPTPDELATVSEGVLVKQAGSDLTYGVGFEEVLVSAIDEDDLPVMLAEGIYDGQDEETDYSQKIRFENKDTNMIVFEQDSETDEEKTETYLKLEKGEIAYKYILEFDNGVEFTDEDNFKGTYISLLGNEYKITNVGVDNSDVIDELTLLGGAVTITLGQGESLNVELDEISYDITVDWIGTSSGESKAAFTINDISTGSIKEGQTKKVSGIRVGVDEIYEEEAGETDPDQVKFFIGAQQLELQKGDEIKLNAETVDGSNVEFQGTANIWDGFSITYEPEDEVFLSAGDEWNDPIFEKFKFVFTGLDKETEEIKITTDKDDEAAINFINNDGDEISIPFVDDNVLIYPGDELVDAGVETNQNGTFMAGGNLLIADGNSVTMTSGDLSDLDEIKLLVVNQWGESGIVVVDDIDITNHVLDIDGDEESYINGTDKEFDVGFAKMTIYLDDTTLTAINISKYGGMFQTESLADIEIGMDSMKIYNSDGDDLGGFDFVLDGTDNDIIISEPSITLTREEDDSDWKVGIDNQAYGSIWRWNSDDKDTLTIEYPEEKVIAKVYISPITAEVVSKSTDESEYTEVATKVTIGYAKLASELLAADPEMNQHNYLLIGGPCASDATAKVMGVEKTHPECAEGFIEGKAMIKLYDTGADKFAMVVAGYSALDTQRATRVLADYEEYALGGDEMIVTGTGLTDIKVSVVEPEAE